MATDRLAAELEEATEQARANPDLTLLEVTAPPATETFTLAERPLPDAVTLAADLGVSELYLFREETGDGELGRAGVAFSHDGHVHAMYRETTTWNVERALPVVEDTDDAADVAGPGERVRVRSAGDDNSPTAGSDADDTGGGAVDAAGEGGTTESADSAADGEDTARKRQLAEELLTEYGEQLSEGDEWRLTERLDQLTVPRLLDMREEARRQARLDPAEEERLARIVFRDGRFNREYDPEDTELLLNALDIDYDEDAVRIDRVHRTAMNLRTVDE